MVRYFIVLPLFLIFFIDCSRATTLSSADRKILHTFWEYAEQKQLDHLPVPERIPWIASFFLDTPYKSNTLNVTREELPVINLREMDCVTFVENVLALAYLKEYNDQATEVFIQNIIRIRYRDAEIVDYTSRLHYSSDWLYEMQRQGLLTDLTCFAGGVKYTKTLNFMSAHCDRYPQLQKDKKLLEKIKEIETAVSRRTYYYIPKEEVHQAYGKIKNGDVLLMTTNIKGLDTSHLGFAYKKDGQTYLIHASSAGKKVMLSEVPLQEYMQDIKNQTGVMIGRARKAAGN